MKKGFTLVELLATIALLGILALIVVPTATKSVKKSREKAYDIQVESIENAAKNWGISNYNLLTEGDETVVSIPQLISGGYITKTESGKLLDPRNDSEMAGCVTISYDNAYNQYIYKYSEDCEAPGYKDNSGANKPKLFTNMIPVKYNGTNWVVADKFTKWYDYDAKEWANAVVLNNGVSKNAGDTLNIDTDVAQMYVWIPRYKYTIFNDTPNVTGVAEQEIQVTFEKNIERTGTVSCTYSIGTDSSETCTDTNGTIVKGTSTYTHPAFKLGDTELTGIWVGKFETGSSIMNTCTPTEGSIGNNCDVTTGIIQIKPNVTSWRAARVGTFYTAIKALANQNSMTNADSHMMKNMEWGAVAYLAQSKYGRCSGDTCTEISKNDSSNFLTGKSQGTTTPTDSSTPNGTYNYDTTEGQMASTTNNIYGIYDMSGGSWEYVMANIAISINAIIVVGDDATYNSGFKGNYYDGTVASGTSAVFTLDTKYTNIYDYDNTHHYTFFRGMLGDATKETVISDSGWYGDLSAFPYGGYSWFVRSGYYDFDTRNGIFNFCPSRGSADINDTARVVLSSVIN